MKKYRIDYYFNHPKMGFQNSITVTASSVDEAITKAQNEVKDYHKSLVD